jgi:hypothetical protein
MMRMSVQFSNKRVGKAVAQRVHRHPLAEIGRQTGRLASLVQPFRSHRPVFGATGKQPIAGTAKPVILPQVAASPSHRVDANSNAKRYVLSS